MKLIIQYFCGEEIEEESSLQDSILSEVEKINPVESVSIGFNDENLENEDSYSTSNDTALSSTNISEITKFIISEYGVDEKCLKIN